VAEPDEGAQPQQRSDLLDLARQRFAAAFGGRDVGGVAIAPGRVNLIGEHTDYNEGFVLPMAIDRWVAAAFAVTDTGQLRAHSTAFGETRTVPRTQLPEATGTWMDYVVGVARELEGEGVAPVGVDLALISNIPVGSGLSSSAAIELATARALVAAAGATWDPRAAALLSQRAENAYVGVHCGIMDQLVVACAEDGCALLLDCRDLTTVSIPMPSAAAVVVMDTGAPRDLAATGYNERRQQCERAVEVIRGFAPSVRALRDVDGSMLEKARGQLEPTVFKRAQHVVAETARPADMADALRQGDLARCGALMTDSHWSLRDLYQVSCPELDLMTSLARAHPACHGARLTGAGFGGCAIALVDVAEAASFADQIERQYRQLVDLPAALHVCRPVEGAALD
jgi:galactokinase